MILDKMDYFYNTGADSTGYTAANEGLGGHESGTSQIKDLKAPKNFDGSQKLYLNVVGTANLVASGAETITIALCSDSAVGFATAKVTDWTSAAIAKGSVAAYRAKILLPEDIKRYARVEWTISGTSTDGGDFKAFLSVQ